jgi:hypothetical protein
MSRTALAVSAADRSRRGWLAKPSPARRRLGGHPSGSQWPGQVRAAGPTLYALIRDVGAGGAVVLAAVGRAASVAHPTLSCSSWPPVSSPTRTERPDDCRLWSLRGRSHPASTRGRQRGPRHSRSGRRRSRGGGTATWTNSRGGTAMLGIAARGRAPLRPRPAHRDARRRRGASHADRPNMLVCARLCGTIDPWRSIRTGTGRSGPARRCTDACSSATPRC